jgi:glycosyltransferase involved in cell wall biosynthesis
MRVTIDLSAAAHGRGGIGRYCARLAAALIRQPGVQLRALYNAPRSARLPADLAALPAVRVPLGDKPWRAGLAAAQLLRIPLDRWLGDCDVYHATDHLLPPLGVPTVFTVHDLAFLVEPQTHLPTNRLYLAAMMPRYARAASAVIAVSEATRRDLLRYYRLPPERVRVVHLGVEPEFRPLDAATARARVAKRYGLAGPYVLFVGTLEPRKNVRALLAAFAALVRAPSDANRSPPLQLAIAGAPGWWYDDLYRWVRARGLDSLVRFLGRVADADLPALYSACAAFAYPSLYEGFGLPPLEALACGAPVVCSDRSSLPEVVGDAALQIDPTRPAALAAALRRVLDDESLRQTLRARGLARAAGFTWGRTAAGTLTVYEQVREQTARAKRRR